MRLTPRRFSMLAPGIAIPLAERAVAYFKIDPQYSTMISAAAVLAFIGLCELLTVLE